MPPEQLTAQLEAITAQTRVNPVASSVEAPTPGQVAEAATEDASDAGAAADGLLQTLDRKGHDIVLGRCA